MYKRKSRSDAKNYRGVHLTPQLSKAVERVFAKLLEGRLEFGPRQFAYKKGHGHRDALLFNICSWLSCLESGCRVGLYCSDVSGAFDKVDREYATRKVRSAGLPRQLASVLESWLDDREQQVFVQGSKSSCFGLRDSVYQGTVLGPQPWNLYFADSRFAVPRVGLTEVVYADDLNAFKAFLRRVPANDVLERLQQCQVSLHRWGFGNRVEFDLGKEDIFLLDRWSTSCRTFKVLGVVFDEKLRMHAAVHELAVQAGWRLRAILRARAFFTIRQLVHLYRAQVLSYIESGSAAFFHAAASVLSPLDGIHSRFVRALGLTESDAAVRFGMLPLGTRRDIAALGFLHRRVLGLAPRCFDELFPLDGPSTARHETRRLSHLHSKQLRDPVQGRETEVFKRSIFGTIAIYNMLPTSLVDLCSVKRFQFVLAASFREQARVGTLGWEGMFSTSRRTMNIVRFQSSIVRVMA